ncbi:uncharacterized protein METZ01_LOCUS165380, partial [marine metagenome]
ILILPDDLKLILNQLILHLNIHIQ